VRHSDHRAWHRLLTYLGGSVVLWVVAVAAAYWFLRAMNEADLRAGGTTDADSIGLPLMSFAILLAGVLTVANLALMAVAAWRRRRSRRVESRPAV
jgi:hypothetical protein